ncbi:MAG: type II secretion system F family protein [Lautropia sp.]|nr:type II secretion system F family protein [Lautropia sp.]
MSASTTVQAVMVAGQGAGWDGWFWLAAVALALAVIAAALVMMPGMAKAGEGYHRHFSGRVGRGMKELLLYVDVNRLFRANLLLGGMACLVVWFLTRSWVLVVAALLAAGALPSLLIARLSHVRRQRFAQQLPDAMMLVAGGIRAGASMTLALRQMAAELPAPGGQEFELMLRELRLGVTLDDALLNLERRMACDDLRLFGAAVRIANESGGNLAETLERLADTIRKKIALEEKIVALTSQGRMQGWVMVCLPFGVACALFVLEPDSMAPLIHTWQGLVVCALVVVLELMGLMFIRRIMAIDV